MTLRALQEGVELLAGPPLAAIAPRLQRRRVGEPVDGCDAAAEDPVQRRADAATVLRRVAQSTQREDAPTRQQDLVALQGRFVWRGRLLFGLAEREPTAQLRHPVCLFERERVAQREERARLPPRHPRFGQSLLPTVVADRVRVDRIAAQASLELSVDRRARGEERVEVLAVLVDERHQRRALFGRQDLRDRPGEAVARDAVAAVDAQVDEAEVLAGLARGVVVVVGRRPGHPGEQPGRQVPQLLLPAIPAATHPLVEPRLVRALQAEPPELATHRAAAQRRQLRALRLTERTNDVPKALGEREAQRGLGLAEPRPEPLDVGQRHRLPDQHPLELPVDPEARAPAGLERRPLVLEQLQDPLALRPVERCVDLLAHSAPADGVTARDAEAHEPEVVREAPDRDIVVLLRAARQPRQRARDHRVLLLARRHPQLSLEVTTPGPGAVLRK